jgi:F0F1-type ATP synthase assembly protein I
MFAGQREDSLLWKAKMKRVIFLQFIVSLAFGSLLLLWWDWGISGSFIIGGVLVSLNAWVMAKAFSSADVNQKAVYRSAVFRYIGVFLVLFFLAVAGFNLLAVGGGMFVAYLAGYIFSANDALNDWKKPAGF